MYEKIKGNQWEETSTSGQDGIAHPRTTKNLWIWYSRQTLGNTERWKEGGQARHFRTWGITWQWLLQVFFLLLVYPRWGAGEAWAPTLLTCTDKRPFSFSKGPWIGGLSGQKTFLIIPALLQPNTKETTAPPPKCLWGWSGSWVMVGRARLNRLMPY